MRWASTPGGLDSTLHGFRGPLHGIHAAAEAAAEGTGPEDQGDEGREGGDSEGEAAGERVDLYSNGLPREAAPKPWALAAATTMLR